ncbi:hypothetical protein SAMN05216325_102101 [Nitrosomonas marina]|uniref:Uncharacterized protein n=1 Tax=Nitrosomonas marina TaxID=917 RepID=A0A1H8B481_9PROT|nr:hypothetical protein SAMN05216325_102101 [Nitrosomonas marina]
MMGRPVSLLDDRDRNALGDRAINTGNINDNCGDKRLGIFFVVNNLERNVLLKTYLINDWICF